MQRSCPAPGHTGMQQTQILPDCKRPCCSWKPQTLWPIWSAMRLRWATMREMSCTLSQRWAGASSLLCSEKAQDLRCDVFGLCRSCKWPRVRHVSTSCMLGTCLMMPPDKCNTRLDVSSGKDEKDGVGNAGVGGEGCGE